MRSRLDIHFERTPDGRTRVGGVLRSPPLWCRWDGATLWMVGSAASPVGDDSVSVTLTVGSGVEARVRSVAALIAYAADAAGTRLEVELHVAAGSTLWWSPEPTILTPRARHRATTRVDVGGDGAVAVDDVVVLGRSGEPAGELATTMEAYVDGEVALATSWDTTTPGWAGPGGVGGATVIANRLVVAPPLRRIETTEPPDEHAALLRAEGGPRLAVTRGDDVAHVVDRLDRTLVLTAALGGRADPSSS